MPKQDKKFVMRTISLPKADDTELTTVSELMGIDRSSLLRLFMKEGIRRLRQGELTFGLKDGKFE